MRFFKRNNAKQIRPIDATELAIQTACNINYLMAYLKNTKSQLAHTPKRGEREKREVLIARENWLLGKLAEEQLEHARFMTMLED